MSECEIECSLEEGRRAEALRMAIEARTGIEQDQTTIARASAYEGYLRGEAGHPAADADAKPAPFAGDDITHVSHHQI